MEYTGIIHVAGERTSKYDFARAIAKKFGFDEDLIEAITMKEIHFKARRPRNSSLDNSRAREHNKDRFLHARKFSQHILQ